MEIEYKGANCVVLKTKTDIVIVDPTENTKLKDYGENTIVLWTDDSVKNKTQSGFAIDMPGEYEHGEVSIRGVAMKRHLDPNEYGKKGTAYRVEFGGVRVVITGHIDAPVSDDDLEALGVADIAIVPVGGGGFTLDAKDAATVIRQISPRVAIPTHFDDGTTYEVPQESLEIFNKEFGGLFDDKGTKAVIKNIETLPEGPAAWEIKKS